MGRGGGWNCPVAHHYNFNEAHFAKMWLKRKKERKLKNRIRRWWGKVQGKEEEESFTDEAMDQEELMMNDLKLWNSQSTTDFGGTSYLGGLFFRAGFRKWKWE